MKRKTKYFSEYQRSMFNKYEVDESYLQTGKQRRACLELLEKIDSRQPIDEKKAIGKLASVFQGSALYKKIASCLTIAALLTTLQSTPAMALASSTYRPMADITYSTALTSPNSVVLDRDSFLDMVKPTARQEIKTSSLHLLSSQALQNAYAPMGDSGVLIDEDSDIAYYPLKKDRTLTVIDTSLVDWTTLHDAVSEGDILLLEGESDPLDTIIAKLDEMGEIDCLNILSHGDSGVLKFRNSVIDAMELEQNKDKWTKISASLSSDGDIQLFGCNVAKGVEGRAFIEKLAQLTGADVAASINPTGSETKGGDWKLEAVVGDVAGNLPFTREAVEKFMQLLFPAQPAGFTPPSFNDDDSDGILTDQYFSVSGTVNGSHKNMSNWGSFVNIYDYSDNSSFSIKVEADGIDLRSFELNNIGFYFSANDQPGTLSNLVITGHLAGGGPSDTIDTDVPIVLNAYNGHYAFVTKNNFPSWNNLAGKNLDYFVISGDISGSEAWPTGVRITSFTVNNMVGSNSAPIINKNTGLILNKGSDATTISNTMLKVIDSEQGTQDLTYTIGTAPTKGTLKKETTPLTAASTFSQADIDTGKITYTPTLNHTGADSFTFTVNDGFGGNISSTTFNIAINDAPTITSGATVNFAENGTGTVYDADGSDPEGGTITWSISGTDAARFNIISATGVVTFINAPNFESPSDNGANNEYNFTITATDSGMLTATQNMTVTVTDVNDAPAITSVAAASTAENSVATGYTSIGTDEDHNAITWSISGGADAARFSINPATGALTFNSAPDYDAPSDSDTNNTYIVILRASDGALTADKTVTITVTNVNEAPSISIGAPASFAENGTGTVYDADGSDPDSGDTLTWSIGGTDAALFNIVSTTGVVTFKAAPNFESPSDSDANNEYNFTITATDGEMLTATQNRTVTVTNVNDAPAITSGAAASTAENSVTTGYTAIGTDEDHNAITWSISGGADAAKFSIDPVTGALTFNSAPDYDAPSDSDTNNTYIVILRASDGALTADKTVTITVTNVNEAPSVSTGATANFAENGTGTVYDANASDPDSGDTLSWSISGTDADRFNINSSTGVVTFKTAPNYESPSDDGTNNVYDFTVTATDNGGLTATKNVAVTVTNVNETPAITSGAAASTPENAVATGYTAAGNDPEGDALNWSIGGGDAALFSINGATGILTFNTPPDYDAPSDYDANNTYLVIILAYDGALASTKNVTITVTNVNEAPSILIGGVASFAENGTGTVYDANGTDPDSGDTLTWSISGTDAALFNINSTTGVVAFKAAPNYESPSDGGANNVYDFTVTATDSSGLTAAENVAVTVTNVNDAPAITSGAAANAPENAVATGYTAAGADDEIHAITWSISGGADAAKFSIDPVTGALTFNSAPDYDSPSDSDSNNSYVVIIQASDGALVSTKTVTITVTNVNEAPSISTGGVASFAENGTGTVYDANGTDPDSGDTLTWSISGTDAALFDINSSTGVVTFKSAPNYESPSDDGANNVYDFTITVTDSGGLTAVINVAVTVTNVNEAPAITSGSTASTPENAVATGYTTTGTDDELSAITWSISGGVDAAKFSIDPATGALTFSSAPDYESPSDSDTNNTYLVILQASDGTLAATKTVTITVTNVNEAPSISTGTSADFAENGTGTVYDADGSDPDSGDTLTWSISGTDAARFDINSTTGVVTFKTAPNFESPSDDGANNVYDFTVTVTDNGGLTAAKNVAVTVTNVNDAPVITSGSTASFLEKGSGTVYTAIGSDPEGDPVTWSISGGDAALFSINGATGVLTFNTVPVFATPADSNHDNIYSTTLTAEDSHGLQTSINLAITVTQISSGSSDSGSSTTQPPTTIILVDGQEQSAGTTQTTTTGDRTVTTVTVDDTKLEKFLEKKDEHSTVTIPVNTGADTIVGQLNGQTVKNMEAKDAVLEIKSETVTYTLPAAEINIDDVSEQIGKQVALKDIKVQISIAEPRQDTVRIVESTATQNSYHIVVRPVEFEITCTSGNKTVDITRFNGYVERTVAIPDGIDPSKITTGIVLNADGTFSHVPTTITVINGKYYAKINSLTNSTYSVIYNPMEFSDVANHWSRDAANDMGSRLVVTGDENNHFNPSSEISRAEFAAVIVKALGLKPGIGEIRFKDVPENDQYCGYIETAASYGIISGYGNGNFGPDDKITREQALTMITKAMKITKLYDSLSEQETATILSRYVDTSTASGYARESLAQCLKAGIISGKGNGIIAPRDKITRAEVAVIIRNLLLKSDLI